MHYTHAQTATRPKATNDGVAHAYCCDRNISWCGLNVTDLEDAPGDLPPEGCVVCHDAMNRPCVICGE